MDRTSGVRVHDKQSNLKGEWRKEGINERCGTFVLTERVDGESERVREKENQRIAILT